jgi:hypothetical protein
MALNACSPLAHTAGKISLLTSGALFLHHVEYFVTFGMRRTYISKSYILSFGFGMLSLLRLGPISVALDTGWKRN